jgi:hypothetical protein
MEISSEATHPASVIVHLKVFTPVERLETVEFSSVGLSTVAPPVITLHAPLPAEGVFPANVPVLVLHSSWSGPASTVGTDPLAISTSSNELAQAPFEIVHRKVDVPAVKPVIPEEGEDGVVIFPLPEIFVHVPVPTVGVFPANVAELEQMLWSVPASATVGKSSTEIITSLAEVQFPFVIVHRSVDVLPIVRPVTPDAGSVLSVILAEPEITDQEPLPTPGLLAAKVEVVVLQRFWFGPAFDAVGGEETIISTSSKESTQLPLLIVHLKVAVLPIVKPVIPEFGDEGEVMVALPPTTVHVPVPAAGVLPASVVVVTLQRFWFVPAFAVVGVWYELMVTSDVLDGQEPLEIVHRSRELPPIVKPVTPDVGEDGVVTEAVPDITDQLPVPTVGVFPARVVVVVLHKFWLDPALAVVGNAWFVIVTSSSKLMQDPLEIVHFMVTGEPGVKPVIVVDGSLGSVMVAVPEEIVHVPVPTAGVLPARVAVFALQRVWSGPAFAVDGVVATLILTSSVELLQAPFDIVHLNTAVLPETRPVTEDVGEEGVVIVAVPETTDQVPVPVVGVFPASVVELVLHKFWLGPASAVVGLASTFIVTSLSDVPQAPAVIVHFNTELVPMVNPVTPEVGEAGVVTEAEPDTTLQLPVPKVGVLPARVAVVVLQRFWLGPAFDAVGVLFVTIVTSSKESGQTPLLMVHLNTEEAP